MWDLPPFEALLDLGRIFRVIVLDKRGTGLSDRSLGFGSATIGIRYGEETERTWTAIASRRTWLA